MRLPALALVLLAAAPANAFVTSVSSTFAIGGAADSSILCPVGSPLGGGFDSVNFGALRARGSGVAEPAAPGEAIERWAVQLLNPGGTAQDYRFAAVCGALPGLVYRFETTTQPAGGASDDSVSCPVGTVAIGGGGLTTGGGTDSRLTASAPTFADSPFGNDLSDQPDGEAVLPRGWNVAYDNLGAGTTGIVFVACADFDDVHPIVVSDTVSGGASKVVVADCPPGTAAVAGGFDAAQRTGLRLAASSPLFPGFIFPESIFAIDGATAENAESWRVVVHSDSLLATTFQVVAMCVPEPASGSVGVVVAALAALARRRAGAATRE